MNVVFKEGCKKKWTFPFMNRYNTLPHKWKIDPLRKYWSNIFSCEFRFPGRGSKLVFTTMSTWSLNTTDDTKFDQLNEIEGLKGILHGDWGQYFRHVKSSSWLNILFLLMKLSYFFQTFLNGDEDTSLQVFIHQQQRMIVQGMMERGVEKRMKELFRKEWE